MLRVDATAHPKTFRCENTRSFSTFNSQMNSHGNGRVVLIVHRIPWISNQWRGMGPCWRLKSPCVRVHWATRQRPLERRAARVPRQEAFLPVWDLILWIGNMPSIQYEMASLVVRYVGAKVKGSSYSKLLYSRPGRKVIVVKLGESR